MHERLFTKTGLSLERLYTFVRLVEAKGFTAAAQGDPNQQSQFSRQLKELETYFGAELVKRGRGEFTLTPAGESLVKIVRSQLSALAEFAQTCASETVELSIGAGESLIHWLILPRLGRLRKALPKHRFVLKNLRAGQIAEQLTGNRIDFGLLRGDAIGKSLRTAPILPLEYALFAPCVLLQGSVPRQQARILDDLPLALLEGGGSMASAVRDVAVKGNLRLKVIVECSSYTQLAEVVRRLEAAAVLPVLAEPTLDPATVQRVDLPFLRGFRRAMVLAWNPRSIAIRPALEKACQILPKHLSQA